MLAGKLVDAVRSADGHAQRVTAAAGDELRRLAGIGQGERARGGIPFQTAELAQFRLDSDPLIMGALDDAAGDFDVLIERLPRCVNHHRAEQAPFDAVVAQLFAAVIEIDGENGVGKKVRRPADQCIDHAFVAVSVGGATDLQDERRH